jgi:hypothetical protein
MITEKAWEHLETSQGKKPSRLSNEMAGFNGYRLAAI